MCSTCPLIETLAEKNDFRTKICTNKSVYWYIIGFVLSTDSLETVYSRVVWSPEKKI